MVSTFASIDPRLLASMARRAMFLGLRNQPWQMDCQGQHAISFKKSCMLNNVNLRWKRHAPWFAATRGIYWAHTVLHPRTVFLLIASVANGLSMHAIKEPPSHSLIADDGPQHFRSGFSHVLAIHDLKYFEKKRPVQQIPIWVQAWQDYDRPIGFNECHNRNMWPCFRRSSLRRLWFREQPSEDLEGVAFQCDLSGSFLCGTRGKPSETFDLGPDDCMIFFRRGFPVVHQFLVFVLSYLDKKKEDSWNSP